MIHALKRARYSVAEVRPRRRWVRVAALTLAALLVLVAYAFAGTDSETPRRDGAVLIYAGGALLLAVLSAVWAIRWMDANMPGWLGEPKDEGRVLPRRGWE